MLTLRQIEVIRAIMVTGTVGGAARLLNVSSPGISRVMKHAETSVGVKLFDRQGGRYAPTNEAHAIFDQINGVYDKIEDLQFVISRIKRGADSELKVASVPSIANVMVPRALANVRKAFPNLLIDCDILKIEDAVDYLLLGKGELVALSSKIEHPMLTCAPLARGRLKCIVPVDHALASRTRVRTDEIVGYPLIGVDPNDPYGRIMADLFASHSLDYDVTIRARFGSTVCALVTQGLGIAIVDEFTLAANNWPDVRVLDLVEPTAFQTYVVHRKDAPLSRYAALFVDALREHMEGLGAPAAPARRGQAAAAREVRRR
ncbi:MAG: LysR family transcriptional regulator [Proteobacteria bacterium]|nr:LysR family transcriptional regulator [Pseudomonadota bacterium]